MVRFRSLFLALAFASIAIAARTDPPPAASSEKLRIVAFGSSSTQGIGASSRSASYPSQLAALLRNTIRGREVAVLNRGIGGDDASAMARRLDRDVIALRPHLVIWQTGSNDPMTQNPVSKFERQTRDAVTAMQASGIEVILMEPQWAPTLEKIATTNRYRDAVRKIGAEMRVTVIRRSDLMREWVKRGLMTQAQMMSTDGLHMADKGYAALARSVADEVFKSKSYGQLPRTQRTQVAMVRS